MRILMVSIPSLHFFRWTEQLRDSGHEVFWFDITGMSTTVDRINWVIQKTAWKLRWDYPGRVLIKSKFPKTYNNIQKLNQRSTSQVFEEYLIEIKPDVVHSFSIQLAGLPILAVMKRHQNLKWIYSSWGSDIYNKKGKINFDLNLNLFFAEIGYMFSDNQRDFIIAKKYGFKGVHLGVFPGGGGYDLEAIDKFLMIQEKRKIILIKGYEGALGRCINVLKAIENLKTLFLDFEIVVFGAPESVFNYVQNSILSSWKNFKIYHSISHQEVLFLMSSASIYIGNSTSDGLPNSLLEAICSGVFPIQSNPGNVTTEVIKDGFNGRLIIKPDSVKHIQKVILETLQKQNIKEGISFNLLSLRPKFEINYISTEVKKAYNMVEQYNKLL